MKGHCYPHQSWLDSDADHRELKLFRNGKGPAVALAINQLQMGYDDPALNWVLIAKATGEKSTSEVVQIIGRLGRNNPLEPNKVGYVLTFSDCPLDGVFLGHTGIVENGYTFDADAQKRLPTWSPNIYPKCLLKNITQYYRDSQVLQPPLPLSDAPHALMDQKIGGKRPLTIQSSSSQSSSSFFESKRRRTGTAVSIASVSTPSVSNLAVSTALRKHFVPPVPISSSSSTVFSLRQSEEKKPTVEEKKPTVKKYYYHATALENVKKIKEQGLLIDQACVNPFGLAYDHRDVPRCIYLSSEREKCKVFMEKMITLLGKNIEGVVLLEVTLDASYKCITSKDGTICCFTEKIPPENIKEIETLRHKDEPIEGEENVIDENMETDELEVDQDEELGQVPISEPGPEDLSDKPDAEAEESDGEVERPKPPLSRLA